MRKHLPINEHSKDYIKRQKVQAYKDRVKAEKVAARASIEAMCNEMHAFILDPRYKGTKFLLSELLANVLIRRDGLRNNTKTNEEYLRAALICDTEISLLRNILEMPKRFAACLKELKEQNKQNREA